MLIGFAALLVLLLALAAAMVFARALSRRTLRELADAQLRMHAGFQELASAALRENTDLFLKLARESFGREQAGMQGVWREREQAFNALIEPIRTAIANTEAQVASAERERRDAFVSLRTQIETMAQSQFALQRETRNLVTALRRPEVRGRWGELTLRRVIELAGMSEHCDFTEQASVGAPGAALRPDLIVHLPEDRVLVIDAKAPLDAYLEAIDAPSEELRAVALARHAQQVEARVRELASKAYWTQFQRSPEFAVLFLPGDQFFSSALAERPELLENALRDRVIVATPSTLIALLRAVAYGWRQVAAAENATQIRDLGQELHRRLANFMAHFLKAGRQLGGAVDAYNSAVGSFERQVLPGARRLSELAGISGEAPATPQPIEQPVREPPRAADEADAADA